MPRLIEIRTSPHLKWARTVPQIMRTVVLAHLSEVNNRPHLVQEEVCRHLSGSGNLNILLAEQGRPLPLLDVLTESDPVVFSSSVIAAQ